MKKYIIFLFVFLVSCADSKDFDTPQGFVTIEPYGWMDDELKNDCVVYKINAGNVIWDIITIETIVVPVLLTGYQLYEPVRWKKGCICEITRDTLYWEEKRHDR